MICADIMRMGMDMRGLICDNLGYHVVAPLLHSMYYYPQVY
jgi:hypothetical protein